MTHDKLGEEGLCNLPERRVSYQYWTLPSLQCSISLSYAIMLHFNGGITKIQKIQNPLDAHCDKVSQDLLTTLVVYPNSFFCFVFYILMFFPRLSVATFSFNCIPISLLSVLNHEREWVWAIPWQKTSNSQATPATAPFAGWSPLNWRLFSCPPIWKWG